MANPDDAIRSRALQFASTLDWIDPEITNVSPASSDIVVRCGNGIVDDYREITVEMRWSTLQVEKMIGEAEGAQKIAVESFLDSIMTVLITCSASDIIAHHFQRIDRD